MIKDVLKIRRRLGPFAAFILGCGLAQSPLADLAPAFTGKVTVDTAFVTSAQQATDIAFTGDGRALVTLKSGEVIVRRADGTLSTIAYPFGGTFDMSSEKGLLGVVADPHVASNQRFYFFVSNGPTNDKHRVYRATLTASNGLLVDATPVLGASVGVGPGLEGPANHDGGGLSIHNNQLYISIGDTGANASPPVNKYGSCLNKGNGKILRVNLDGSVPNDNPLVGFSAVTACDSPTGPWLTAPPDKRIFAWGFRNPWRMWVDPRTGLLWTGDVGERSQEEVSIGAGNQHYGYPFVEGAQVWGNVDGKNCNVGMTPGRACTAPAYSYPRSVGTTVTGGLVLDTPAWTYVLGSPHYIFGDSSANWLRLLPVNAARNGFTSSVPLDFANFGGAPVSIRQGPDGALYVVYFGLGAVYRFTPVTPCPPFCKPPLAPRGLKVFAN